jgi:putative flippase GtrA
MRRQFVRYLAAGLTSFGVQLLVMAGLVELLHVHYLAARVLSVGAPAILLFFVHRNWTFGLATSSRRGCGRETAAGGPSRSASPRRRL